MAEKTNWYQYTDETSRCWRIKTTALLAETGGLQRTDESAYSLLPELIKPRYVWLQEFDPPRDRLPARQKVILERDRLVDIFEQRPIQFGDLQMFCKSYYGEIVFTESQKAGKGTASSRPPQISLARDGYIYIDDTGNAWKIECAQYLAEAGGLENAAQRVGGYMPPRYTPRHIKLVALEDRPGMQKYRADVVTNERDPGKLINTIIVVQGREMRCMRYVGEQRRG